MKVLHVWNVANVPYELVNGLRNRGDIDAQLIDRIYPPVKDRLHAGLRGPAWYHETETVYHFQAKIFAMIRDFDIIHVHCYDPIIPQLKLLRCTKNGNKAVILHYHGEDIRGKWDFDQKQYLYSHADLIAVSTEDLLKGSPKGTIYVPNPVSQLKYQREQQFIPGTALFTDHQWLNGSKTPLCYAEMFCQSRELLLRSQVRNNTIFSYDSFPRFLELFEYYIDIKTDGKGAIIDVMSLTGLQALALGCKVYHMGKVYYEFPERHAMNRVVDAWMTIYEELLNRRKSDVPFQVTRSLSV